MMQYVNTIIKNDDIEILNKYRNDRNLHQKYEHQQGTWDNVDAFVKWSASMIIFDQFKNLLYPQPGIKVVDLGSGDGPVPHMVADRGYDVVAVDIKKWDFLYQSLAQMVTKDCRDYLEECESGSVDLFMDGCAVTHFNDDGDTVTPNKGWRSILESVYRVLRPGGYFICLSDIDIRTETCIGEYIIPEDIVRMAEESGLVLATEFDYSRDEIWERARSLPGKVDGPPNLGVACFVFKHPGYQALLNILEVKESDVAGQGIYATENIPRGTILGVSHVIIDEEIHRTPLGGFINHKDKPNCMKYLEGNKYYIKTTKKIGRGKELFLKYSFYEVK